MIVIIYLAYGIGSYTLFVCFGYLLFISMIMLTLCLPLFKLACDVSPLYKRALPSIFRYLGGDVSGGGG